MSGGADLRDSALAPAELRTRLARTWGTGSGLMGIAWAAGGVMLLDRADAIAAAEAAGLFLWARE